MLNASLRGVFEETREHRSGRLWGAQGGLGGLLRGRVLDLLRIPPRHFAEIARQPGSFIGSYRGPVTEEDLDRIIVFLRRRDIRRFFYTGGNGSMATALAIARRAAERGFELVTVGIPKTADNDLCETDHCPGFGSAARFLADAVRQIGLDQRALPTPVSLIEVMGRNTGWLAAAALLARNRPDDPPHFIYVPERPFNPDEFLTRIDRLLRKQGWVVGVVAEGLRLASGRLVHASSGSNRDAHGRPLTGDVAARLGLMISRKLKVRVRSEKPGLLFRAFASFRSEVDASEAFEAGRFAVSAAVRGESGVMVTLMRAPSRRYRCSYSIVPLERVAGRERRLPLRYLAGPAGIDEDYIRYVAPLTG